MIVKHLRLLMDEKKEIAKLFDIWNNAVMSGDPHSVAALYNSEDVVFLPTLSSRIRTDHEGVLNYFNTFCSLPKIKGEITESHIRNYGDIAMNSGNYNFTFEKDGEPQLVKARFTYIYRKIRDEWKIIEHHSSAQPES